MAKIPEQDDINRDYVFGQGINYFFLAALAAFATTQNAIDPLADKPTFYIDKSSIIPIPIINIHFNLTYWLSFSFTLIVLLLAVYFVLSRFINRWTFKAVRRAYNLSPFFGAFMGISFLMSWLSAVTPLLKAGNYQIAAAFVYSGIIVGILLSIHTLISFAKLGISTKENLNGKED